MDRVTKVEAVTDQLFKHPMRYPHHASDKGQIWGGECNATRCGNHNATKWNIAAYALYCDRCASVINQGANFCISVAEKPDEKEMDRLHDLGRKIP